MFFVFCLHFTFLFPLPLSLSILPPYFVICHTLSFPFLPLLATTFTPLLCHLSYFVILFYSSFGYYIFSSSKRQKSLFVTRLCVFVTCYYTYVILLLIRIRLQQKSSRSDKYWLSYDVCYICYIIG